MKKYLIVTGILLAVLGMTAQQEYYFTLGKDGKAIAIPKFKKFDFNIPEYAYKLHLPANSKQVDWRATELSGSWEPSLGELPADVQVLSAAYRPFFNPFTPMMMRVSPFALDFSEVSILEVNEKLALVTTGRHTTWPLLGRQTDIRSMLFWQHQRLTIGGGLFVGRYTTPFSLAPESMGGANLMMRFELTDKFALRAWGDYTMYSKDPKRNPYVSDSPLYNYTGFGGALEYMFNENFGVGGGVDYQFNYRKGRLEPRPVLYPIFKSGGVRIGVHR
ncbi:hypothetical protein FACS1894181_12600 [Bacteroidia bacterium]|nr:hypothetical protein FACS1894181_12600 [Bacteroidia bacterium]